jgi:LuxR family maltose regulon positive regulatory protein
VNNQTDVFSTAWQDYPLLRTKLYVPPVRPELVPRPRLIEQLNPGLQRKLTLISAPAGFGKTTLVTEWLASAQRPFTWLSLDENDNEPARFLTYLVVALQRIGPTIGQAAQAMLQAPQRPPPESLLTTLINDIATTSQPFVLVLDDYHLIHTLPVHLQLTFLLEHQPTQMHLVIVTREDPPLPLSRWRAGGQMVEIRQADLKFTEEETADFLRRVMGLQLSPADVAALHRRTEGWIAGLQLAALSMRGHDDVREFVESFTGSHRYILDYLIEEVFQRQPADVQDFLLKTSILDRFTAPLCDAVTERDDSRQVLPGLEQANLFIVPLDASRQWYRYHRLFADLLRHRLQTAGPQDLVPLLHKRASQWYEAAGFPADAVHHTLAASDWERAATLIHNATETMLKRGEITTLLGWFQALPDEVVRAQPQLCLDYGWALTLTGQIDAAESYWGQAEQAAQDDTALLGEILAAQSYAARARGDDRRTIELSQRALSLLPQDNLAGRSVVAVNLGIAHWSSGHLAEAEQALTEADHAARQSGNQYARLTALGFLGVVQAARGKLHQAAELLRLAIQLGEGSPTIALAHNELSALFYEWNDLEAAADHLQRGIELGQRGGNVEVQIGSYRTLARLKQAQGDVPAALDALQKAHQLAREKDVPPLMHARNAACHVEIALAQADLATAIHWAEQVTADADASPFYPLLGLTPARLLLAQKEKAAATGQLAAWYERAVRAGWQFGVVEVRVLQVLAAPTPTAALAYLADALALGEPEGFIRSFVDAGGSLVPLLRQAATQGIARQYVGQLLRACEADARRRAGTEAPPRAQPLIEPLSQRELEVLRLVAAGLSNREIADALFVSVNTVKTHLQRIYGKLGVRSRTAAVTRAQELNVR